MRSSRTAMAPLGRVPSVGPDESEGDLPEERLERAPDVPVRPELCSHQVRVDGPGQLPLVAAEAHLHRVASRGEVDVLLGRQIGVELRGIEPLRPGAPGEGEAVGPGIRSHREPDGPLASDAAPRGDDHRPLDQPGARGEVLQRGLDVVRPEHRPPFLADPGVEDLRVAELQVLHHRLHRDQLGERGKRSVRTWFWLLEDRLDPLAVHLPREDAAEKGSPAQGDGQPLGVQRGLVQEGVRPGDLQPGDGVPEGEERDIDVLELALDALHPVERLAGLAPGQRPAAIAPTRNATATTPSRTRSRILKTRPVLRARRHRRLGRWGPRPTESNSR